MMYENNCKAIENFTPKQLAELYRDYCNNWSGLVHWASSIFPEEFNDDEMYNFYEICKNFHKLGF